MRSSTMTIPLVLVLILAGSVSAQLPVPPIVLEGFVYVHGVPAEDGTLVEARIEDVPVASCRTATVDGRPGYYLLAICCDPGDEVRFFVEGEEARESPWQCGSPFAGTLTVPSSGPPARRFFLPLVMKR